MMTQHSLPLGQVMHLLSFYELVTPLIALSVSPDPTSNHMTKEKATKKIGKIIKRIPLFGYTIRTLQKRKACCNYKVAKSFRRVI